MLGQFAAYYYKDYKQTEEVNDSHPVVLQPESFEVQQIDSVNLPTKVRLMTRNETMKRRKVKAVIRYHKPNKTTEPERFFHHLLMLYLPWRDENELLEHDGTYHSKFILPDVKEVVQNNQQNFEPHAEAIDDALAYFQNNPYHDPYGERFDASTEQEHADMQEDSSLQDEVASDVSNDNECVFPNESRSTTSVQTTSLLGLSYQPPELSDNQYRMLARSLNSEQREAHRVVLQWSRAKMKALTSKTPNIFYVDPIHIFVTGGAGAGKNHLINAIYQTATKTFRHGPQDPNQPSVLLLAPTGVAAINIAGNTINSGLAIPKDNFPGHIAKMSDQRRTHLRTQLSHLKLIVIDEISMVSNAKIRLVHERLQEIFCTPDSLLFAGLSVVVVGDFYQLPPVRERMIFAPYKKDIYNLCHPWDQFKMIELNQIMRQCGDQLFTEILNRVKTADITDEDARVLSSRERKQGDVAYPKDALHIYAENIPAKQHNLEMLESLDNPLVILKAHDEYPQNISIPDLMQILNKRNTECEGLSPEISVKENSRIMLTTNIDIQDRLINGQMGTIRKVKFNVIYNKPQTVYVEFDDVTAGHQRIQQSGDLYAIENSFVPLQPVLAEIKIKPNKPSSLTVKRTQFPLTLAWACTVHKVQGLTLDRIVVSFELHKQKYFNYGQIYVALSRVKLLNDLFILGTFDKKHIRADERVHEEYKRLRSSPNHASIANLPFPMCKTY